MEGFYGNIGGKIKGAAFLVAVLGIIGSVICGVMIWLGFGSSIGGYGNNGVTIFFTGLIWAVVGSLISYIGSWLLYAFGTMVENLQILADSVTYGSATHGSTSHSSADAAENPVSSATQASKYWRCTKCGCVNHRSESSCEHCGRPKVI